ncbi:hypothetical protein LXL04_014277 [Taraxacum kok-saghyz]
MRASQDRTPAGNPSKVQSCLGGDDLAVKQRPAGSPLLPRLSSLETSYRPSNHIGWNRKQGTKRSREEWLTGEGDSAWFLDRQRFPRHVAAPLRLRFFPPAPSLLTAVPSRLRYSALVESLRSLSRVSNDIIAPGTVYPQSSPSHQADL